MGFLCLVVLVLLRDFYKETIMYNPLQEIEVTVKKASNAVGQIPSVPEKGWSKEITEDNLFSPTRSPLLPKPPQSQLQMKLVEPPKRPDMVLKGVVLDQFDEYVAYIEKDRARAVAARKGDRLDDVEVVDVKQKSVDLKWNDETISLTLDKIKTIKSPR